MRPFSVLLTCCSVHVKEMIDSIKQNDENVPVKVYVTNMSEAALPPEGLCDGNILLPPVSATNYISSLLDVCKKYDIDIIIPTATLELEKMAINARLFEENGIKVSVSPLNALNVANDKIMLHNKYGELMPDEYIALTEVDVDLFIKKYGTEGGVCCKVANLCGGKGFAIVDNEKCLEVGLFGKFGEPRYISHQDLRDIVKRGNNVIMQERIKGTDYTVSILADKGKVVRAAGYAGYIMCFGSIFYGEIKYNSQAYEIAERIVNELGLDGNVAFDFIIKEDGSAVLLECNPRVNASVAFVKQAGCNLIYERCKMMLGEKLEEEYHINMGMKMKKLYDSRYYV